MRFLTARTPISAIGVFWRAPDNDKFWLQDLADKELYVSEECCVFDRQCDQFKLMLEGHRLCKIERKNKGYYVLPKKPVLMTSNFIPWMYCKQHKAALLERMFFYDWRNANVTGVDFDFMYSCTDEDFYEVHMYMMYECTQ